MNNKNQGFILSFPPMVGIIFICKIATFRVIFEASSQFPEGLLGNKQEHFAVQK
jgi:hypothetical protein